MLGAALDYLRDLRRRQQWAPAQAAGRRGEDLAHRFLRRQGFVIVARNYRLAAGDGEADLIAWDGNTLVIVEVKSRESGAYGPPDRAIGEEKLRNMRRVAREYSTKTATPWEQVRFDVVAVLLTGRPEITHYRAVRAT
jgi:putative endonuclease